ncbi:DUF1801 domain-containing protein [Cellulomonas sp. DKR-3]|uniref:DUF1801 domain-containing protein n=1 Tax=Cellulomonas fulva TaxID=2835530 RepID=A0ABS5U2Y6_9CELL|nr:DUF1801 domain-containing protein [Cellulomonas fulva]MBT0995736.1 DUF1801 domain-containing protein [Cellulomonas fulva]
MGEVTAYVESLPEPARAAVERVYARARAIVPEATEGLGYGMPALVHRGKPLVSVMVARAHIGLYPFSPRALDTVREELAGFSLSKGTVRFSAQAPVPDEVLDRLLQARRAEIEG